MVLSFIRNVLFIMFLAFISASCDSNDISNTQSREIDFFQICKGNLGGMGEEGISESNLIISNNSDWQSLLTQIDSVNSFSSGFSEVDIDFDQFTVLAVFLDVKPSIWYV